MSSKPLQSARAFITPIWVMGILSSVRIFLLATNIIAIRKLKLNHGAGLFRVVLISGVILIGVLTTEAVLYWIIRRRVYNRRWVWLHLSFSVFAIVVLPLVLMAYTWLLDYGFYIQNAGDTMRRANQFRIYFFWMFFIAGTIFFIANLIKSFQEKNLLMEDEIDAIGRKE